MCEMPRVTNLRYDRSVNRTFAVVKTREFTSTFYVSGSVTEREFLSWVQPTIDRMMDDSGVSHG